MAINEQDKITVPFANSGLRNDIPETATGSNLASMQEGFPAVTMTDIASGGQPPDGKDFNGILNVITKILQYAQSGGLYKYDADYAEAVNGYPVGAILRSADGSKIWMNTTANNSSDPDNGGQNWVAITDASSMASALSAYLPKSGGTMTGGLTVQNAMIVPKWTNVARGTLPTVNTYNTAYRVQDSNAKTLSQYQDITYTDGRHLVELAVYKPDDASSNDNSHVRFGWKADGTRTFSFQDNEVLTTASTLDASKLNVSYLPTAGGNVTGSIVAKVNQAIVRDSSTAAVQIHGGTSNSDGAFLALYGKDSAVSVKGGFRIFATDGTNSPILQGTPAGSLRWNENEVLTTENGLPLSGGTMTGNITFASTQEFPSDPTKADASTVENKANKDFSNATKPYVTEFGSNSSGWWKIFSNGWVEQGNTASASTSWEQTVTLPIEMKNTSYSVILGRLGTTYNSSSNYSVPMVLARNTASIKFYRGTNSNTYQVIWKVEGYKK